MPAFGRKKDAAPHTPKLTKHEKTLHAEMDAQAELMRVAGIDMPSTSPAARPAATARGSSSSPPGPMDVAYSANKARQNHGDQKTVKLSFADRLTDKVAAGAFPLMPTLWWPSLSPLISLSRLSL
jgi:hypothetical protein